MTDRFWYNHINMFFFPSLQLSCCAAEPAEQAYRSYNTLLAVLLLYIYNIYVFINAQVNQMNI